MDIEQDMKDLLGEEFCKYCEKLSFLKCYYCRIVFCSLDCMLMDKHDHFSQLVNSLEPLEKLQLAEEKTENFHRMDVLLQKSSAAISRRNGKSLNAEAAAFTPSSKKPKGNLVLDLSNGILKQKLMHD